MQLNSIYFLPRAHHRNSTTRIRSDSLMPSSNARNCSAGVATQFSSAAITTAAELSAIGSAPSLCGLLESLLLQFTLARAIGFHRTEYLGFARSYTQNARIASERHHEMIG
jgi:hypothetical protein